ncbi:MAG: Kelch repeat-containing protein [Nitrospirota bacterium]
MSWERLPDLAIARSHPAVAVHHGRVYAIGGGGPGFASLDAVEIFDPETERWRAARPMPTKRSGAMAVTLGDRIAVIGGGFKKPDGKFRFLPTVEFYEPAADRWSSGPDMLRPHDYPACALLDGRVYIATGHHPDATEGGPQTDPGFSFAQRWRPGEAAWEELPSVPTPRFAAAAVVLGGGVAVAGGVAFTPTGFMEFDRVEAFDPAGRQWARAGWSLPWTAAAHGLAVLGRRLLVCGGFSGDEGIAAAAAICDLDSRDQPEPWRTLPSLPEPRAAMGTAVIGGRLILVGGWAADRSVLSSVRAWRDE